MGYKRELRQLKVYGSKPSLFTDRDTIRGDIPRELQESLEEMGKMLEVFGVPYLKKIVYSAMYYCYNIDRV